MSARTPGRRTTGTSARGPDLRRWGRRLIAASAVASATLPWLADWNRRHTFGPEYGPHARWHGTSEVLSATLDGLIALWLLREGERDNPVSEPTVTVAALLPIARWAPFNLTLLLPGVVFVLFRIPWRGPLTGDVSIGCLFATLAGLYMIHNLMNAMTVPVIVAGAAAIAGFRPAPSAKPAAAGSPANRKASPVAAGRNRASMSASYGRFR